MRRGIVAFVALALIGLGITGCGLFRFEQREPWRIQAEQACLSQGLVQPTAYMARSSAIDGPGACGISYPFKVAAFGEGAVGLSRQATFACPIIPTIDGWLTEVVQPAASLYFGTAVAEVKSGSYSCRPRNSRNGAKLSEHAFGNAIDVMGFRLADGREVTVVRGWRGAPDEQEFLREVFVGACQHFRTVLGPGADAFHYDHFHLDLARHDARGQRRVCKPILKFTPRLDAYSAGSGGQSPRQTPRQTWQPAEPQPEIDLEEDHDPFEVSSAAGRGRVAAQAAPGPRVPAGAWDRPSQTAVQPTYDLPKPRATAYSEPPPPLRQQPTYDLPRPRALASSEPSPPPLRLQRSTSVEPPLPLPPLPPGRPPRGLEPIPPYEPPPRGAPMVLQPPARGGQGAYRSAY